MQVIQLKLLHASPPGAAVDEARQLSNVLAGLRQDDVTH